MVYNSECHNVSHVASMCKEAFFDIPSQAYVQYLYSICTVYVRFGSVQILYIYCTNTVHMPMLPAFFCAFEPLRTIKTAKAR